MDVALAKLLVDELKGILMGIFRKMKRNGVLVKNKITGVRVGALDGVELAKSNVKNFKIV